MKNKIFGLPKLRENTFFLSWYNKKEEQSALKTIGEINIRFDAQRFVSILYPSVLETVREKLIHIYFSPWGIFVEL